MRKRAGSLAEISPVRSEIMGRRDENSPCEHASPVTEMKCSVLIGLQFASGRFHLLKRDKISHMKPGHILSHLTGYLAKRDHMNRPLELTTIYVPFGPQASEQEFAHSYQ